MRPNRRHLLLLPGGLAAGHAAEAETFGHSSTWAGGLVRVLLCLGAPMALWALLVAVHDGWQGRSTAERAGVLVAQQAAAFTVLAVAEHVARGSSPIHLVTRPGFWARLALHGAIGLAAWLGLRVATRVGRRLAATAGASGWWPPVRSSAARRSVDIGPLLVALSSLSRRGPPAVAPTPLST